MKCANCKYYARKVNPENLAENQGECRRYPPMPFPIPTQQGISLMTVSPAVDGNNHCGEFVELVFDPSAG